jgi:hypothetical protein
MSRTDRQIVDEANELALRFAEALGYKIDLEVGLYNAADPRLQQCWAFACIAFDQLQATPADEALENLRGDGEEPTLEQLKADHIASMAPARSKR